METCLLFSHRIQFVLNSTLFTELNASDASKPRLSPWLSENGAADTQGSYILASRRTHVYIQF